LDVTRVNDYTVDALIFMVEHKIFSIPSLECGLKVGQIKDYESFKKFYDFEFYTEMTTPTPASKACLNFPEKSTPPKKQDINLSYQVPMMEPLQDFPP
jgi:hypothetical protein